LRAQYDCVENAPTSVNAKEWVNLTTAQTWPCPLTLECQTERDYGDTQQCFRLKEGLLDPESLFGFDHLGQGFVTMIYIMSQDDGPETVAEALLNAGASAAGLAWPFCVGAIVVISLIGLQLFLALVVNALTNTQAVLNAKMHEDAVYRRMSQPRKQPAATALDMVPGVEVVVGGLANSAGALIDGFSNGFDFDAAREELADELKDKDFSKKRCGGFRECSRKMVLSSLWRRLVVVLIMMWAGVLVNKFDDMSDAYLQNILMLEQAVVVFFCLEFIIAISVRRHSLRTFGLLVSELRVPPEL
jgi:hypothetical protein